MYVYIPARILVIRWENVLELHFVVNIISLVRKQLSSRTCTYTGLQNELVRLESAFLYFVDLKTSKSTWTHAFILFHLFYWNIVLHHDVQYIMLFMCIILECQRRTCRSSSATRSLFGASRRATTRWLICAFRSFHRPKSSQKTSLTPAATKTTAMSSSSNNRWTRIF